MDDFVGTGESAKKELFTGANRIRKSEELSRWADRKDRIVFMPLWGFTGGIDNVQSELGDLISICPVRYLDEEDRAFSTDSDLYETAEERRYAENVFRRIGQQLDSDHPLGWGNCQGLVIFENTVPNNTLPALWRGGTVEERVWRPLFSRP